MVAPFFISDSEVKKVVKINGKTVKAVKKTIAEYLKEAGYDIKRVAVEKNGNIVPKSEYETTVFCDGDSVEIVSFVGGG